MTVDFRCSYSWITAHMSSGRCNPSNVYSSSLWNSVLFTFVFIPIHSSSPVRSSFLRFDQGFVWPWVNLVHSMPSKNICLLSANDFTFLLYVYARFLCSLALIPQMKLEWQRCWPASNLLTGEVAGHHIDNSLRKYGSKGLKMVFFSYVSVQ